MYLLIILKLQPNPIYFKNMNKRVLKPINRVVIDVEDILCPTETDNSEVNESFISYVPKQSGLKHRNYICDALQESIDTKLDSINDEVKISHDIEEESNEVYASNEYFSENKLAHNRNKNINSLDVVIKLSDGKIKRKQNIELVSLFTCNYSLLNILASKRSKKKRTESLPSYLGNFCNLTF